MGKVKVSVEDQVAKAIEVNEDMTAEVIYRILDISPKRKKYYSLLKKAHRTITETDRLELQLKRYKLLNSILFDFINFMDEE